MVTSTVHCQNRTLTAVKPSWSRSTHRKLAGSWDDKHPFWAASNLCWAISKFWWKLGFGRLRICSINLFFPLTVALSLLEISNHSPRTLIISARILLPILSRKKKLIGSAACYTTRLSGGYRGNHKSCWTLNIERWGSIVVGMDVIDKWLTIIIYLQRSACAHYKLSSVYAVLL